MPRCETCQAMRPSADVRKLPRRDAYRCKDKFACELARTNRDPYTATITITFPAKSHREAWDILDGLRLDPFPLTRETVTGPDGTVTHGPDDLAGITVDDIRAAVGRSS